MRISIYPYFIFCIRWSYNKLTFYLRMQSYIRVRQLDKALLLKYWQGCRYWCEQKAVNPLSAPANSCFQNTCYWCSEILMKVFVRSSQTLFVITHSNFSSEVRRISICCTVGFLWAHNCCLFSDSRPTLGFKERQMFSSHFDNGSLSQQT